MNYLQTVAYIESLAPTILNPDLTRFSLFMDEHEQIHNKIPSIHVAGTNGKGSTVAILDAVLRAGGLKVGRFTGPHLLRWNERFHLNGQPIADDVFAEYATKLREDSEQFGRRHPQLGYLTWFEFLTALVFRYFADNRVDLAVYEVGLGGRWDATNVLARPLVSVITTIALDHTHILGETLSAIAREKAGIIKHGVPVVTGADGEAFREIAARATELGAELIHCQPPDVVQGGPPFDRPAFDAVLTRLSLQGEYQKFNCLLALAALNVAADRQNLHLDPVSAAENGLSNVFWPGRFQYLPEQRVLLDGAHNPAGARALRLALDQVFPHTERHFVLSFFQTKNVPAAIAELIRPGDRVFASEAQTARAVCPAQDIVDACTAAGAQAIACMTISDAFNSAIQSRGNKDGLVIASGSFATVKESMLALGWQSVEDGRRQTGPILLH
jgi:dihydrofolate synthase/folylpolyglutamate synthase